MDAAAEGMRDPGSLGKLTPDVLRNTFPGWRIFQNLNAWWATRGGIQAWNGSRSLLQRALIGESLERLAEKLCLQEWLDGLGSEELLAVWRDMTLPGDPGERTHR
jgi:hypothetical protein